MADIFDRDHLPKDEAEQSKLIRWIPLHHHVWSSAFLRYGHPFQTLHCRNPTETSAHPRRILGCCILTIGEPVITMLNQSCGVSAEKNKQTEQYARVFRCCDLISHVIWPTKIRGKVQPMSFTSSSSLCYTCRKKKTFYTWAFTSIMGWGLSGFLTWAERYLLRPSSW